MVTFFLNKALKSLGVKTNLVGYWTIYDDDPPECDHSVVTAGSAFMNFDVARAKIRPHVFGTEEKREKAKRFCDRIYKTTRGKVTMSIDSNFSFWDRYFDKVFTIAPPRFPVDPSSKKFSRRYGKDSKAKYWIYPERYVWIGWGADPEYCYPDKNEQKTIFIDYYEVNPVYAEKCRKWYDIYDCVLKTLSDVKIHDNRVRPKLSERLPWPQLQKLFRESHFSIDPQLGVGGLTRVESSMCGCLLVTSKAMYAKWAMDPLETATWETEEELREILSRETDPERIHKRARVQTWDKVAKRIIRSLND